MRFVAWRMIMARSPRISRLAQPSPATPTLSTGIVPPAGEPRKASQRRTRRAAPSQVSVSSVWHPGDKVRWRDRIGDFQRDLGDGEHAEIMIFDYHRAATSLRNG